MNILILAPFLPYPLDQGGKIRIFNIIKNLAKSHAVTLAALVDDTGTADAAPLRRLCAEVILVERPARLWPDRFAFFTGSDAYNVIRYRSPEMREKLQQLRKLKTFDLVQVEFPMMWQYADVFADTLSSSTPTTSNTITSGRSAAPLAARCGGLSTAWRSSGSGPWRSVPGGNAPSVSRCRTGSGTRSPSAPATRRR